LGEAIVLYRVVVSLFFRQFAGGSTLRWIVAGDAQGFDRIFVILCRVLFVKGKDHFVFSFSLKVSIIVYPLNYFLKDFRGYIYILAEKKILKFF
jgi:hypothetical protein